MCANKNKCTRKYNKCIKNCNPMSFYQTYLVVNVTLYYSRIINEFTREINVLRRVRKSSGGLKKNNKKKFKKMFIDTAKILPMCYIF